MKRNRKRTKAIQELVNETNAYLKLMNIKDPYKSDLFAFVTDKLLKKKMYEGYNFYKRAYDKNGNEYNQLAGSCDPEHYQFIQIY